MNVAQLFIRLFFFVLSILFITTYMFSKQVGSHLENALWGLAIGTLFGGLLLGFDFLFKRFNLRSFNIAILGIFIGYLMGQALVLILNAILDISAPSLVLSSSVIEVIKIAFFLFGIYLGTLITLRASDELAVSIPFVRFSAISQKKKDVLVDHSVLSDSRIIDLSASGLLDQQLVIPRFVIKDLYDQAEIGDERARARARKAIDVLKKLEENQNLSIRYNDTDFPDVKDFMGKMIRLARLLDAHILSADISKVQSAMIEGVRIINIHTLSQALKPLMEEGEHIKIKIQRFGKEPRDEREPRQGIGYLDDGTMVVVNGGGEYMGEVVEAQVISVTRTSSGRMIFCNVVKEGDKGNHQHHNNNDYPK